MVDRVAREWRFANPVLLVVGVASIVVAVVGLFVRSSPTLSAVFVIVGAALLVLSFLVSTTDTGSANTLAEINLPALKRNTRSAESEIAQGELHVLDEGGADDTAPLTRAFASSATADALRHTDEQTARALTEELHALPILDQASRMAPIEDVAAGYRSVTLPSGYLAVYRRLTPLEVKEATGVFTEHDAFFVADLVALIPSHAPVH